jgi:hypothetical protein
VEEKVFMLYRRLSDRGSIPGLIHRTSGKGFSPRFVSRLLLHTPTLTRAELSTRLVSAHIPHIRGEVVPANFGELRHGEVPRIPLPRNPVNNLFGECAGLGSLASSLLAGKGYGKDVL